MKLADIPAILQTGLAGLAFLLALLSYMLLAREQRSSKARPEVLRVFDLSHVIQEAASVIRTAGLDGRCEIVGGSYWDAVPAGGDTHTIKSVLMDKTDEEAATLLRNVRSAMDPRGTLLVIERLIGAPNQDPVDAFFDLQMLVGPGGGVRRQDEWAPLFAAGEFSLDSVTPTASRFYVLEGRPSK
jgi:hypothetical protein